MTITWRVWVCSHCFAQMSINYQATEEDYQRFKDCHCGGGQYVYQYDNVEEPNED